MAASSTTKLARIAALATTRYERALAAPRSRLYSAPGPSREIKAIFDNRAPGAQKVRKELEKLIALNDARRRAALNKARAQAVRTSRDRAVTVRQLVEQRVLAFEALASVASARREFLGAPFEISAAGMALTSSAVVHGGSWARFALETDRDAGATLYFKFLWANTQDRYVVINANGYIVLDGYALTQCPGGYFAGDRYASIDGTTNLQVANWSSPPYGTLLDIAQAGVIDISCNAYGMFDFDGGFDAGYVYRGYDLQAPLVIVPPRTNVGLTVSLNVRIGTGHNGGEASLDFAGGQHRVLAPGVLVTVVS